MLPNYTVVGLQQHLVVEQMPFDNLERLVRTRSQAFDREVERMVTEWGTDKRFVGGSPEAMLWLRERLGAVRALLRFLPGGESSFFRKGRMSEEASVRWLLLDWWRIIGNYWYAVWLKTAGPSPAMKNNLKRKITYYADDGTAFDKRIAAKKHELDLKRRERIEKCLREILPDPTTLSWDAIVAAMVLNAGKLSEALSARAAARESRESKTRQPKVRTHAR